MLILTLCVGCVNTLIAREAVETIGRYRTKKNMTVPIEGLRFQKSIHSVPTVIRISYRSRTSIVLAALFRRSSISLNSYQRAPARIRHIFSYSFWVYGIYMAAKTVRRTYWDTARSIVEKLSRVDAPVIADSNRRLSEAPVLCTLLLLLQRRN